MTVTAGGEAEHRLRTDLKPCGTKFITLLALDGGGIRGLIPARVIEALEYRAGLAAGRMFDIIAGTSTGGLIALGLTRPAADRKRPLYSAAEIVEFYRTQGPKVFRRSLGHFLLSLGGLAGPKYSADPLEPILQSYFGATRITEALTSVLVTSYDTASASPYFFKSYRSAAPSDDYMMWQVARATSAAPTFFPPFQLQAIDGRSGEKSLVDGGVFANNPAMCALADAYKMFREFDLPYLVVSIGTGNDELRYSYSEVRAWGLLRWAVPILKIVFDGVSDSVDYQTDEIADEYFRFQEDSVAIAMDDVLPDTIRQLLEAADDLIAKRDFELTALANILKDNVAPVGPSSR